MRYLKTELFMLGMGAFVLLSLLLTVSLKDKEEPRPCAFYKTQIDSLRTELRAQNFRVERVRFYVNICMKNPKQDKFLKGWVKRAVE